MIWTIFKSSLPTSDNTLRLHYKEQPINAVQENNRYLLQELYEIHNKVRV
jgi:hypothetical protein